MGAPTNDHRVILAAAVAGDDGALGALVRLYHARLWRFGRRVCHDEFDADDAVQEAFVELARRPLVQQSPGVLAWLFTVVKHACLRFLRRTRMVRRRLGERVDGDEEPDPAPTQEEGLERYRVTELVRDAIARLDPPLRAVLILRDIEGLSGSEVCAALGVSEAAMKSRLHRARSELRASLRPLVAGGDSRTSRPG
jgi:RNA polymerase sigma-70 factor, ECF subfamily